jgi:hypothetical protein
LEAGDLIHPTSGLMKPGEGLAQVLGNDRKTGGGQDGNTLDTLKHSVYLICKGKKRKGG